MPFYAFALLVGAVATDPSGGGLLGPFRRWRSVRRRIEDENALKHVLQQKNHGLAATFTSVAGALRVGDRRVTAIILRLEELGLLETRGQAFTLTSEGERLAIQVVRAHRLWERYLADEARLPLDRVHQVAERREHKLTPEQVDHLDALLGHPTIDPHGDPIPTRDGQLAQPPGTPLTAWAADTPGVIVHLEDEPPVVYAQLVAEGLRVGQVVRVIDTASDRLILSDGENEFRLAPVVAGNVFLARVAEAEDTHPDAFPLSGVTDGSTVEVVALLSTCRGYTRRRLLDLGFTPGTRITPVLDTFAGDPRAYRVRGTTIALRREQADEILVRDMSVPAPRRGSSRREAGADAAPPTPPGAPPAGPAGGTAS